MDRPFSFMEASFDQFEELAEVVSEWDLEFHQLSPTIAQAKLAQLATVETVINHIHIGCIFDQQGHTPDGYRTFGVLASKTPSITFRGQTAHPDNLMCFPKDNELSATSPASFDAYTLSIRKDFLDARIYQLTGLDPEVLLYPEGAVLEGVPHQVNELRSFIEWTFQQASLFAQKPALLAALLNTIDFENTVVRRLAQCLQSAKKATQRLSSKKIQHAIEQSVQIIRHESQDPLIIRDLAKRLDISQSSLEHGFKKHFGVNPKKYLKYTQLNLARNLLLHSDSQTTKVTDIANLYGFWHMGQFAKDYKNLFGELPRQTLKSHIG